jgi:hypothetical protein
VSQRLWEQARDAEKLLVDLELFLNKNEQRLWWQHARYRRADGAWQLGHKRPVMRSLAEFADLKVVLRPGADGVDYTIVALKPSNEAERFEAAGGRSLKDETFIVLRPTDNIEDVVVVIQRSYNLLAEYLKTPIRYSWDRLTHGIELRKIRMGEDTVFLLTFVGTQYRECLRDLKDALTDAGVGTVTTDPFETKRARQLCEKYGQDCK